METMENFHGNNFFSTRGISMEAMEVDDVNKKRKVRSWVWDHYSEIGSNLAECTNCFVHITCQNGTNSMKNHLDKKHNIQKIELVQEKKPKLIFSDTDAANKMLYVL